MPEILSIHNNLFNHLSDWSDEHRFAKTIDNENPFFVLRAGNDKRLSLGQWLPGDDRSVFVSFWTGGDALNRSPNVYLEVSIETGSCRAIIASRDSEDKRAYFEKLMSYLRTFDIVYLPGAEPGVWENPNVSHGENYISSLDEFISRDKMFIDRYLLANDPASLISDYSSAFGFLTVEQHEDGYYSVKDRKAQLETEKAKQAVTEVLTRNASHNAAGDVNESLTKFRPLPYTLRSLSIRNFQGIKATFIDQLPAGIQWIFITGENGYGKSSVLQSIGLCLSDDRVLDRYLEEDSRIEIELYSLSTVQSFVRLKNSMRGRSFDRPDQVVIGYGPVRLNTAPADGRNNDDKSQNSVMNLFQTATTLKNLKYELFAKKHTQKKTFRALEKAVKEATNGRISQIEVKGEEVFFREKLSNGDLLDAVPLEHLAAGFRSVINIIGDIIVRYGERPGSSNYKDFSGIVLIDEIENHLHPLLQRELPEALSRVFPNLQFIASTHSPIPLLGAPKNSVIITVSRSLEKGIEIERLDDQIDFGNLLPNTILTSPIFGFEKIIPAANVNISEIETSPDFATSEEVKEIRESLNLKKIDIDAIDKSLDEQRNSSDAGSPSPA